MNTISSLVAKQFQKVSQISCDITRKPYSKVLRADSVKLVLSYNPILPNTNSLISKYLPILPADLDLKDFFPENLSLQFTEGKKASKKC